VRPDRRLSNRLEGALGQVAETRSTARGMIVIAEGTVAEAPAAP